MKRKNLVLAAVIALVGAALAGTALAQTPQTPNQAPAFYNAQQYGRGGDFGRNHDGTDWGSQRDEGMGWGSQRGRFRAMDLDGRWVADDRDANTGWGRNDFRGRGPMRGVRLPDFITIDQQPWRVKIADGRNRLLQLVMLGGKFDSWHGGDRPDYLTGDWNGRTLVVEHPMPRGTITQTFQLRNHGATLVVTTRREGFGRRDYGRDDYGRDGYGRDDYGRDDYGRDGFGSRVMETTTTYHRA